MNPLWRIQLRPQAAPMKQAGLFAFEPETEETIEAACEHAITEPQASLFGGTDLVCVTRPYRQPLTPNP